MNARFLSQYVSPESRDGHGSNPRNPLNDLGERTCIISLRT